MFCVCISRTLGCTLQHVQSVGANRLGTLQQTLFIWWFAFPIQYFVRLVEIGHLIQSQNFTTSNLRHNQPVWYYFRQFSITFASRQFSTPRRFCVCSIFSPVLQIYRSYMIQHLSLHPVVTEWPKFGSILSPIWCFYMLWIRLSSDVRLPPVWSILGSISTISLSSLNSFISSYYFKRCVTQRFHQLCPYSSSSHESVRIRYIRIL